MTPFILRFAQPMPPLAPELLRYDAERQIAQVLENGQWIDRLSSGAAGENTKFTKVKTETTDDE